MSDARIRFLATGDYSPIPVDHAAVLAFRRRDRTREILVVANFSDAAAAVSIPDAESFNGADLIDEARSVDLAAIALAPHEFLWVG